MFFCSGQLLFSLTASGTRRPFWLKARCQHMFGDPASGRTRWLMTPTHVYLNRSTRLSKYICTGMTRVADIGLRSARYI